MKNFTTCCLLVCLLAWNTITGQVAETYIAGQTWTTKNLDVKTFRNGDAIKHAKTDAEWAAAAAKKQPAWCYYENNAEYGKVFGVLYNWYAVNDPRGLAPVGWHVATEAEWELLFDHVGSRAYAGMALKSRSHWGGLNAGTNLVGFNALPGGNRFEDGVFDGFKEYAGWWTITEFDEQHAYDINISDKSRKVWSYHVVKDDGLYVRCVKDDKTPRRNRSSAVKFK